MIKDKKKKCKLCGLIVDETRGGYCFGCAEALAKEPCTHGNIPGECHQCDFEGDIAFDTWREDQMR